MVAAREVRNWNRKSTGTVRRTMPRFSYGLKKAPEESGWGPPNLSSAGPRPRTDATCTRREYYRRRWRSQQPVSFRHLRPTSDCHASSCQTWYLFEAVLSKHVPREFPQVALLTSHPRRSNCVAASCTARGGSTNSRASRPAAMTPSDSVRAVAKARSSGRTGT